MEKQYFSHSLISRIPYFFLTPFLIYLSIVLGKTFLDLLLATINGTFISNTLMEIISVLSYYFLLFTLSLSAVIIYLNWMPNFDISDSGINLQVFYFFQRSIPWNEVIEVKNIKVPFLGKFSQIVIVNKITPFHRLIGILYGHTLKPGFVIEKQLPGKAKALELILSKMTYI